MSLTCARFEELCQDLFHSTLEPIEKSFGTLKLVNPTSTKTISLSMCHPATAKAPSPSTSGIDGSIELDSHSTCSFNHIISFVGLDGIALASNSSNHHRNQQKYPKSFQHTPITNQAILIQDDKSERTHKCCRHCTCLLHQPPVPGH